ncbi:hypothetical protein FKM82_015105 [Ascaphus truei]
MNPTAALPHCLVIYPYMLFYTSLDTPTSCYPPNCTYRPPYTPQHPLALMPRYIHLYTDLPLHTHPNILLALMPCYIPLTRSHSRVWPLLSMIENP